MLSSAIYSSGQWQLRRGGGVSRKRIVDRIVFQEVPVQPLLLLCPTQILRFVGAQLLLEILEGLLVGQGSLIAPVNRQASFFLAPKVEIHGDQTVIPRVRALPADHRADQYGGRQ